MVTMITDRIGIGDYQDGKQLPNAFDTVLNVAVDIDITTVGQERRHKVGLLDGPGNDDYLLLSAVTLLHSLNRSSSRRILVHCMAGKSRSVMVVSAYVSILTGNDFDSVLREVMKNRQSEEYRPAIYQQYKKLIPLLKTIINGK